MSQSSAPAPGGTPTRHQRSAGGLLGALMVTVVLIVAFVALRAFSRDQPDLQQPAVDYRQTVADLQRADLVVVYPATLPDGWRVIGADYSATDRDWALRMLTDDEEFVGVRQESDSVEDLVAEHVDEEAVTADGHETPGGGGLASSWAGFADAGGDTAYATTLAVADGQEQTVLVYGSAGAADVRRLVDALTVAPLPRP